MATLTEVSYFTRKIVKGTIIIIIGLMVAPVLYRIGVNIYRRLSPEPPPPPTVKFGKLPKLDFPQSGQEPVPTFKLETIQGGLPRMPDQASVYVVGYNQSRLLDFQRTKTKAASFGLKSEPETNDRLTYIWRNEAGTSNLVVNIVTGKWEYNMDWRKDPELLVPTQMPNQGNAIGSAKAVLGRISTLPTDIQNGNAVVTYLQATASGDTREAQPYEEQNMVRVDVFRADLDKLPFVTAGGKTSPVSVVLSGSKLPEKQIIQAKYNYSGIVGNESATYPIRPIDQAWSDLTLGKGYITKNYPEVTVRKVYMGYYESDGPQNFIQPVYVFAGDREFMGYVQAVDPEFIAQ